MAETTRIRGAIDRVDRHSGRFYVWEGERYWSVTTILQAVPQPWLGPWSRKVVAEYAVNHTDLVTAIAGEEGKQAAIDWLKGAPDRQRDRAGNIGTECHKAAEAYVLGQPFPEWTEAQKPYMENAFLPFLDKWKPEFIAVEAPVFSETHRYAGTLDAIMRIDDVLVLVDYKTSKSGVFPEMALQQAAYRHSETFIGLPDGDLEPTPKVDGAAILLLHPDGFKLVPVRSDDVVFNAFLYVREVFRWTQEIERTVVAAEAHADFRHCARCGCHVLLHSKLGCTIPHPSPCHSFRKRPWKKEAQHDLPPAEEGTTVPPAAADEPAPQGAPDGA